MFMSTTTVAVVQDHAQGPIELREVTLPQLGKNDVLVQMHATGVCQSQLYWMEATHKDPMLFGHEGYGTVLATGQAVQSVHEGDKVLITWVPRASDRPAQRSSIELQDGVTAWSPNVYTWAEHTVVDELYVLPIDKKNAQDFVAIVGCAVVTGAGAVCFAADTQPGDTVAIFGAGGVGLSAIAAAAVRGAGRIIAVDLEADKLDLALHFGATDTINASTQDPVAVINELTGGVDKAFDCVANNTTLNQAIDCTRSVMPGTGSPGGTTVLVGLPQGPLTLELGPNRHSGGNLITGQKRLIGTAAGGAKQTDIATFLDWYSQGQLDLAALVTDRYDFVDVHQAVSDLTNRRIRGRALLKMS